jgi:hypothetical protein
MTASSDYWRGLVNMSGRLPSPVARYPEYLDFVKAAAPPLKSKRISVLSDAVASGSVTPSRAFRYQNDAAVATVDTGVAQILSGAVSVREGLAQGARQVTAMEKAGAAEAGTRTHPVG